ncbi:MAG: DUF1501 domain-containing protein, partial [Limisphaerales bacterium]
MSNTAGGFVAMAMGHLLGRSDTLHGMGEPVTHHPPKARRVIQLFMNGGVSPMDTFDYKPALRDLDGQTFDPGGDQRVESVTRSPGFKVMASPFEFKRHGQCGQWVSEVLPHMGSMVDEMAFIMSMHSS